MFRDLSGLRLRLHHRAEQRLLDRLVRSGLEQAIEREWQRLRERLSRGKPRVALVKQDCNEDLYCCPPGEPHWTTISSTLLRSGPVDLFTLFDACFLIVKTEPDDECSIWKEKWDPLRWAPLCWFEAYRDRVPGRDHGQSRFAQASAEIAWSAFDLVVSVDVCVPERITRQHPGVVWSYYVREVKAPSWQRSLDHPLPGQDIFLSQAFDPTPPHRALHVVNFPYHFHHVGVFHELALGQPFSADAQREGVFVDYHSAQTATDEMLSALNAFGPVYAHRLEDQRLDAVTGERIPDRTMVGPALEALLRSKYHVKWGGRPCLGTAKVEAIAAGCVCLTNPALDGTPFLHSDASRNSDFPSLLEKLRAMEKDVELYRREVKRQRRLVDYLCHYRPANDLLDAWRRVQSTRPGGAKPCNRST